MVKNHLERVLFHKNCQKNGKISCFFIFKKTLRNGPLICENFEKHSNQPYFEGEKFLDMGRGFIIPRVAHPINK